jgi:hypothetical protein
MMRPLMRNKVPENTRLRPRELFFILLGVATGAALAVLWFRLVPELMLQKGLGSESLSGLGSLVMHPGFEVLVLVIGVVLLAAGVATRVSSGRDRATWILAAGSVMMFGMLMLSVNAVYDPVFLSGEVEDAFDSP